MTGQQAGQLRTLGGAYFLLFLAVGVTLPFLPAFLHGLGLTPTQVGWLLAVNPTFTLFAPPWWGALADRWGRPGLVSAVLFGGASVGWALLAFASTVWSAAAALAVIATFSTPLTSVLDSVTLRALGGDAAGYPRVRSLGSLAFVLSSVGFGVLATGVDRSVALWPALCQAAAALWCGLTLARNEPRGTTSGNVSGTDWGELLRAPGLVWLLAATALHWIACAPYHGTLALHVQALGLDTVLVSAAVSVGVLAELAIFLTWTKWASRFRTSSLLLVSFGASAVRWGLMGLSSHPAVLVGSSVLHGLTFGVFYGAAVAEVGARSPPTRRASAQALLAAATFGVGGIVGFSASGWAYQRLGGSTLFLVAAALEALPFAVAFVGLRRRPAPPAHPAVLT